MSLTDNMKGIWTNLSQVGQVAVRKGPRVDQYVWDLHNLTDNSTLQNGFIVMSNTDPFWQQVWVDKFADDAGSRFITQLPTYFTVAPFNHKIADKQIYKVDINYSPLISSLDTIEDGIITSESETNIGEHILYGSIIYPAYPLLFTSSIPKQNHYGPVFVQQASFSVSGDNTITPVSIRLSAVGGKAFQCPAKPVSDPSLQTITLTDLPVGDEFDPDSPNPNANLDPNNPNNNDQSSPQTVQDFIQYRVATLQDCLFDTNVYDDFPTFYNTVLINNVIEAITPVNRIVAMELHVKQNVVFTATGLDAVGAIRTQEQGPRWAAIKDRTVEGSITYFSHDSDFTLPKSGGVTMYFGGCYYFPMPNVDWQKPTMQAEAVQGGYIHVFNFIARACIGAITNGFSTAGLGMPVSEFNVGTQYFDNL